MGWSRKNSGKREIIDFHHGKIIKQPLMDLLLLLEEEM
jgi:hypothetical protein